MWELINGVDFYGINKKILKRSSNSEIMYYGFPKEKKHTHLGKFKKRWFGPFKVYYCLPNNIDLVFVNNFEPNMVLANVNKLKPYTYVDQTLKGIQSTKDQKSL